MNAKDEKWTESVTSMMSAFATKFSIKTLSNSRQLSASFEIGCFHALIKDYENQSFKVTPKNLIDGNVFKYLTSPAGNPKNFSFVELSKGSIKAEIRQQVRICSHFDPDIAFTPDLIVLIPGVKLRNRKDKLYANGKKRVFFVLSKDVISAHECKSYSPFPELVVSLLGTLYVGHQWAENFTNTQGGLVSEDGEHLCPTLFLGGSASGFHRKMIYAFVNQFPVNVVDGMHDGTWGLGDAKNRISHLTFLKRRKSLGRVLAQ